MLAKERSLQVWALGGSAAHLLEIPVLHRPIVPQKCKCSVRKGTRIVVELFKQHDRPWTSLRG